MKLNARQLALLYKQSHDLMRNLDGLQPQEAFDELLKFLFLKECADEKGHSFPPFVAPILGQNGVELNRQLLTELRRMLAVFIENANSWSLELWKDKAFRLTDSALLGIYEIFSQVNLSDIDIDIRSAALNEFVPAELRKGLGIFPTPDSIARMMVEIAAPKPSSRVLDPACGTGTFLVNVLRNWGRKRSAGNDLCVWGIDKSARMLLLSELNLGHKKGVRFYRALADSLYQSPNTIFDNIKDGFDFIFTNPPFGVAVDRDKNDMTPFQTCRDLNGKIVKRQHSEVIFIEQCLKYLRPGGLLGIIVPRSVVTNKSLNAARCAINKLGFLETIVHLPPETFCMAGTQTNTVILFVRRYKSSKEKSSSIRVVSVNIKNVGFDSTGRVRDGCQLNEVAKAIRQTRRGVLSHDYIRLLPLVPKDESIARLPDLLSGRIRSTKSSNTILLGDLVDIAVNGKTPGRANYSMDGLFLVKVGNLTGQGIDWSIRDRNFISGPEADKRLQNPSLMLRRGDILLTSSAHSPVYIAKKVDIVGTIPKQVGGRASFVGEVMMIRVRKGVDPFILLAYLRLPSTQERIQALIRGQTAHLHPEDLLDMHVPKSLVNPPSQLRKLADQMRSENTLSEKLSMLAFEQKENIAILENILST